MSLLQAALIAREAHRRRLVPRQVGLVPLLERMPTRITIAGKRLSLEAAAHIAAAADEQRVTPQRMVELIVLREALRLGRRRRKSRKKT